MSIRALNQNFRSSGFAANTDEQGPPHPFLLPGGEGDHPYPNAWSFQSGNGPVRRPGHPYRSPWAQVGDEDQGNEGNHESSYDPAFRKPYHFLGYTEQPRTYRDPLPRHQSHVYPGPTENRKPYPSPWDDDNVERCSRKPYPYPGPADGHKPHPYPGAVPWRQPYPFPWEEHDKDKPSFPRQPYQLPGKSHTACPFPQQPYKYPGNPQGLNSFHQQPYPFHSGQHEEHGNGGWCGHGSFGQPHFDDPSFGGVGREEFEGHHPSHGPWAFSQRAPYKFPATGSEKYKPEVDVFDTPETFVIHVPLPGAKKEDVELNWDPKAVEIIITGVINRPGSENLVKAIALDERKVGPFRRNVRLGSRANPPKVDGDSISAKLEDGVLVIEVPKTEPDDIEVKKVEVE
ncbi:hypothetical protein N7537_003227 [Penicillium hordei]|uniref:SHSP domain-containing protein n=1 Tax=Penicillium hordei TaxID=40994 RepID=A0AAD6MPG2_9EURO|nr:uncharacterized protein N7537_003227 [Penicillium hordei]KAJ5618113.1 hypothetical protein N7537_003227 [Penicillium hordei]